MGCTSYGEDRSPYLKAIYHAEFRHRRAQGGRPAKDKIHHTTTNDKEVVRTHLGRELHVSTPRAAARRKGGDCYTICWIEDHEPALTRSEDEVPFSPFESWGMEDATFDSFVLAKTNDPASIGRSNAETIASLKSLTG